jgi:uncharacterized protein (TIGR00369 family)
MLDDLLVNDDPDNRCFGCSPHNEKGLALRFVRREPGVVECEYTAAPHLCGAPGVIHGGIQATLLDEAMGFAVHEHVGTKLWIVTAELRLRYRAPVPVGEPVIVRGRWLRSEGKNHFARAEILDPRGRRATVAESRWRAIDTPLAK